MLQHSVTACAPFELASKKMAIELTPAVTDWLVNRGTYGPRVAASKKTVAAHPPIDGKHYWNKRKGAYIAVRGDGKSRVCKAGGVGEVAASAAADDARMFANNAD